MQSMPKTHTKLPADAENSAQHVTAQTRGRWILLLLLLFFAVPLLLVMLMQHYDWHPAGTSYGVLITPVQPVNMPPGLLIADGRPQPQENPNAAFFEKPASLWLDKWSMVYVAGDCKQDCMQQLHDMRQLHVSFAKDIARIQRVFISTVPLTGADGSSRGLHELQSMYPDLIILYQPAAAIVELSQQFTAHGHDSRLYLVDPLGNLMMRFPQAVPVADVRKDISRLLRYAWAG